MTAGLLAMYPQRTAAPSVWRSACTTPYARPDGGGVALQGDPAMAPLLDGATAGIAGRLDALDAARDRAAADDEDV